MHLSLFWRSHVSEWEENQAHGHVEVEADVISGVLMRIGQMKMDNGGMIGDRIVIHGMTPGEVVRLGEEMIAAARALMPQPTTLERQYAEALLGISSADHFPCRVMYNPRTDFVFWTDATSHNSTDGNLYIGDFASRDEFEAAYPGISGLSVEEVIAQFDLHDSAMQALAH